MRTTNDDRRWATSIIGLTACLLFSTQAAASEPASAADTASVRDRERAAEAYDQGTSAYLSEEYEAAAHWFERAYRVVPTSAALLQAVRAHYKAGNWMRAGNLALELREGYPEEDRSQRAADAVIEKAAPLHVLIRSSCDVSCTLELDGSLVRHSSFFVTPDVEHTLKAAFESGETSNSVRGNAGEVRDVHLVAPAPPPPPPVPRWAFFSSLGATLVLGAATVWSGVDANRGVGDYEAAARTANSPGINEDGSPTPAEEAQALLDEGRAKERRTNVLIGVTAAMAVSTAVLGVFTNWKGEARDRATKRIEPSVGVTHRGGGLTIKGRF